MLDALQETSPTPTPTTLRPNYDLLLATLSGREADSLRRSNWGWSRTTDAPQLRRYASDYIYPAVYNIDVMLIGGIGGVCRWTVDGTVRSSVPCDEPAVLTLAAGPLEDGWGAQADVSVTSDQGLTQSTSFQIRDRLIVAMGDSYISGEGNPDVPSEIDPGIPPLPEFYRPDWIASEAARPYIRAATWWDEPCHRSLLSWPVLASLWQAAQDQQAAITLVHVGCSGASQESGIHAPQHNLPGAGDEHLSQVSQIEDLLADGAGPAGRRPIDEVWLSIGGNDIGFASVIRYATLPPNGYGWGFLDFIPAFIVGATGGDEGTIPPYRSRGGLPLGVFGFWRESAESRLLELPGRFAQTSSTLQNWGVTDSNVTHALYPDIILNDRNDYCRTVLFESDLDDYAVGDPVRIREGAFREFNPDDEGGGFESLLTQLPSLLKRRTNWRFQFQYNPDVDFDGCDVTQARGDDSEVCRAHWVWSHLNQEVRRGREERGWRIADGHLTTGAGHGWCVSPVDSLIMPLSRQVNGEWEWFPASPASFQPYQEDLGRWVRTTNDSVLSQWANSRRMIQGTAHPTFNMHIAYAEAVVQARSQEP